MPAAEVLGWKRSKYWRPILHSSKSPETPRKLFLEIIKNIERKKYIKGAPPGHEGGGRAPLPRGPPGGSPASIFCYIITFTLEKFVGNLTGRNSAATRRNQSRAPAELVCRGNFPPGAGNHHHRYHQRSSHRERAISINIFTSTISSQNSSSSLVSNLVSKPQIGTCGLLVVLITPCSSC